MSFHITAFFGVSLTASSGGTNDDACIGEQVRGPISERLAKTVVTALAVLLVGGCATSARQLMPTPTLYQFPGGQPVFDRIKQSRQTPDLDLLFITDRGPPTPRLA